MAYTYGGIISFLGSCGNNKDLQKRDCRIWYKTGAFTASALYLIAQKLQTYSNANLTGYSLLQRDHLANPLPTTANLDEKAQIYMKDSSDGTIHSIEIPAAKAAMFEKQGEGDRVTVAALNDIVSTIATQTGRSLVPLYGKKIQRG